MKKLVASFVAVLALGLTLTQPALASSLYLVSNTQNPTVGDNFQVDVRLNTEGDQINALQTNLNYPQNLSVESIQTYSLPILAQQTVAGNQINLAQGSITPVAGDLKVATITFQAKQAGIADLSFGSGSAAPRFSDSSDSLNGTQNLNINIVNPSANEAGPSATPAPTDDSSQTLSLVMLWSKIVTWFNS